MCGRAAEETVKMAGWLAVCVGYEFLVINAWPGTVAGEPTVVISRLDGL